MQEAGVAIAAIGVLSAVTTVLGWAVKKLLDFLLKEFSKTMQSLAMSIAKQAAAADNLTKSINKRDAREEEFHAKVMEQFDSLNKNMSTLADRNLEAYLSSTKATVKKQVVKTQVVAHEVVQKKEETA